MKARCVLLLGSLLMQVSAMAQQGAVVGQVILPRLPVPVPSEKYAGTVSGKIAAAPPTIAAVWLEAASLRRPAPRQIVLEQRGYQFASGLLVVPVGSTVVFPNEDSDYHNVFSLSKTKRFDLGRYKKSEKPAPTVQFDEAGVVRLFCEIHEHMRGVILVVDSPHYTRTDGQGAFRLGNLAAGNYVLKAWASEKHKWEQAISLARGQTLRLDVNFARAPKLDLADSRAP